jgi:FixJ family two-component response regulator/glycine cleavage system H lipoate-binding protein
LIVAFIILDILIRMIKERMSATKARKERLSALDTGLNLDFTNEAPTLKRVDVPHPAARILAVDDEAVVLDSFRKILVVAGYAIDTVESGREALGLVQKHKYDFVFTDLKMPEMDGLDVVKGVKHFSPETDVVVITGFATVESAVGAMKCGALDYVQKPFTEDELIDFTKKILIRRQDRQEKQLKPTMHVGTGERQSKHEFMLPGGVFISEHHVWASVTIPGMVRVGLDDFARKLIGRIDAIEFPQKGATVKKGDPLFSIRQGARTAAFVSPVTGQINVVNHELGNHMDWIENNPYEKGWVCSLKPDQLASDLESLKIGDKAAAWYKTEIERIKELLAPKEAGPAEWPKAELVEGQLEETDDRVWDQFTRSFLA